MTDVSTPSDAQVTMVTRAALPRTLMGGTVAMRKAGETYLPKEAAEGRIAYDNRVRRSTLFNAFAKTVADMTGKVFTKPIVLNDDVPPELVRYAEDIDMTGRHINVFARDVFYDGLQAGAGYILTDMPPPLPAGSTKADEQAAGARPYLVYIALENLLGWKSTRIAGAEVLTQIRIKECVAEPDGPYLEKEVEQIRVIEPGAWQTFRKVEDVWVGYESGTYPLNKITLVPFYANRTGFMTGSPPLEKLAEINVAHWQSQSDQRHILHVARVPILFGAGFEVDDKLEIGANSMIRSTNPAAKLIYVEHTGAAIGAGDKDLNNLEFQMQAMGLQLLIPQPGGKSATGAVIDESKENSPLAMMARSLGDAIESSLGFMAEYMGMGVDAGGSVYVNDDYGIQAWHANGAQMALDAAKAGKISNDTFWTIWQRYALLSDDFDPEAESELLKSDTASALPDAGPGKGMNLAVPPPGGPPK